MKILLNPKNFLTLIVFGGLAYYAYEQAHRNDKGSDVEIGRNLAADTPPVSENTKAAKTTEIGNVKASVSSSNAAVSAPSSSPSERVTQLKLLIEKKGAVPGLVLSPSVQAQYLGERSFHNPRKILEAKKIIESSTIKRGEDGSSDRINVVTDSKSGKYYKITEKTFSNGSKKKYYAVADQLIVNLRSTSVSSSFYSALEEIQAEIVEGSPEKGRVTLQLPDPSIETYENAKRVLEDLLSEDADISPNQLAFLN